MLSILRAVLDVTVLVEPTAVLLNRVPVVLLEAIILLALSLFCFSVSGALATVFVGAVFGLAVVVVVAGFDFEAGKAFGEVFDKDV